MPYAVVTPLRKSASYEPRIAILGFWGDTWLTRGKYGIYVAVRGSCGALTMVVNNWLYLLPHNYQPYSTAVFPSKDPNRCHITTSTIVLPNTWYYHGIKLSIKTVKILKVVLRGSYEAAVRNRCEYDIGPVFSKGN